jgi:hypothetical protein
MIPNSLGLGRFVSTTSEPSRSVVSLPLIFAIGIYCLIISHASAVLGDPDTFWHIAIGRWIIAHATVPDHGIFSATMANAPWIDQEWLAEILMGWGYDHFGFAALTVGTALCEAAAIAITLRVLLSILAPVHAMFATILTGALWFPHIFARPYVLTIPILVVWVAGLVRARSDNRAPSPWFALLIVLWANLHGSFMFGIGLAALFASEAVLLAPNWHGRVRAALDWGCFCAPAVGAALITPYGLHGLLFPFHMINMTALTYIAEWQGVNFSQISAMPFELWLLTILFASLSLGWRLPRTRIGILLILLAMTLKHARYMELLGVASSLLLATSLKLPFEPQEAVTRGDRLMAALARPADWRAIVIGAIVLVVSTIALHGGDPQPGDATFPAAAVAEVQSQHLKGPVFNSYEFGGFLIFSGIEPFVDGRVELYGDAFMKGYIDAVNVTNNVLMELLDDYGIRWTIFTPTTPAATLMDYLPGWQRAYTGSAAVVHIRRPSNGVRNDTSFTDRAASVVIPVYNEAGRLFISENP